jgi:hypothetical protein
MRSAPADDTFTAAPVFGLSTRPADSGETTAARAEFDPMDEIESLISAAMRGEAEADPKPAVPAARAHPTLPEPSPRPVNAPRQAPTPQRPQIAAERPQIAPERPAPAPEPHGGPVVPPLSNQFAPRRAALRDREPAAAGPEEAIMAAADAAGIDIDQVELPNLEEPEIVKPVRRRRSGGLLAGVAAVLVLLIAAGIGGYWMLGIGKPKGPAPVLTADASPVKQPAPPAKPTQSEQTRAAVMAQIEGPKPTANANEQLVSRDQSTNTDVASIASDNSEGGLANRKVRTVTVRPDGTIVSNPDSVAGGQVLPVDRPNVPPVPGAAAAPAKASSDVVAPVSASATAKPADVIPSTPIELAPDQVPGLSDHTSLTDMPSAGSAGQGADAAAGKPATDAPVPMPRMNDRPTTPMGPFDVAANSPVNALVANTNAADQLDTGSTSQAAPQPSASGPTTASAYVQIASRRSMADATSSMNTMLNRFGNLFPGATPEIQKVDLGSRGTYYRVRVPASSMEEASRICNSIKANGGDCFPTRG